jgi:eukaryotic-like serine/threonine-protein kinase
LIPGVSGNLRLGGTASVHSRLAEFNGTRRFAIRRRLGAGGMGVVYEAWDNEREVTVALKTLRTPSADALLRLKREFRALQDLSHPNLVSLGELIEDGGAWFFTMELVRGQSFVSYVRGGRDASEALALTDTNASPSGLTDTNLSPSGLTDTNLSPDGLTAARVGPGAARPVRSRAKSEGALDEARLRDALAQLGQGLAALHDAGKIHRDIKPSNILVSDEGRVVLLDFGLVTEAASDPRWSGREVVGTVAYMAPEQAQGGVVGPAADWYGVGVVLYEALTGRRPFDGTVHEVLLAKQRAAPSPRELAARAPADLVALCVELLAVDPARRPAGDEVLARLGVRPSSTGLRALPGARAVPVVGRDAELSRLRDALAAVRGGAQETVLVESDSGMGKTALCRRLLEHAAARGACVLAGRCYEREDVPYKAFDGVMEALARWLERADAVDSGRILAEDGAAAARLFPVLRRVSALARVVEPAQASPQGQRTRSFIAVRRILQRLAARQPLLVFVDDLQWADADSWRLLEELFDPSDAPPLLLVVTARAGAEVAAPLARIQPALVRLELGPLEQPDAVLLVRGLLADASVDLDPAALAREAGGHPLYLQELVQYALAVGADAGRLSLEEVVLARVSRLEAPARRLLEIVAVAGSPLPQRVAADAAGLEPAELARQLPMLRAGNLVRTEGARGADLVEPYHDRVRELVAGALAATEVPRCHLALADVLEASGAAERDPELLVRHLEQAGQPARAAAYAERAAARALGTLAFDRAAELYAKALALGDPSDEERRALQSRRGMALANAGRGKEAAEACLAAADGAAADARREHLRLAAEQLLICGYVEQGLAVIGDVLAEVGMRLPATPRRALASALYWRAAVRLRGLRWKERDPASLDDRARARLEVHRALALGLSLVDPVRGMAFQSRGLILALRAGHERHIAKFLGTEASYRAAAGPRGRRRAQPLLDEARAIGESTGDPYLRAWALGIGGSCDCHAGRFAQGVAALIEAERLFELHGASGRTWELNNGRTVLLLSLAYLGRYRELGARLETYLRDARRRGDRFVETTFARTVNEHWLALDDPDAARGELQATRWAPPAGGIPHVQHVAEALAWARLAFYGDGAAADAEAAWARLSTMERSPLMRFQLVRPACLYAMAGLWLVAPPAPARAGREATRLARRLAREEVGYARAWALLVRAALARRAGDDDGATSILREAIAACEGAEIVAHAAAARRQLGELVGGDAGAALIAEADAWMAAEGIRDPARFSRVLVPGAVAAACSGGGRADARARR